MVVVKEGVALGVGFAQFGMGVDLGVDVAVADEEVELAVVVVVEEGAAPAEGHVGDLLEV